MFRAWASQLKGPALTLGCLAVTACGGGGGGGGTAPPNQPPMASAKLTGEAVLNAPTMFDISASKDPDGSIASHSWTYGDGQSGSARASTLSPWPSVCVQTSMGELVFEVYDKTAPVTVANFLTYVGEGFYNGVIFHRVIPGFVIQAGAYGSGLVAKPATHPPITLESNNGLKNWQYTLAMARTGLPDSATSQFFINLVDNHALDYDATQAVPNGYAVFGLVISGVPVVSAIGAVATGSTGGLANVPLQDVLIRSVVRMP